MGWELCCLLDAFPVVAFIVSCTYMLCYLPVTAPFLWKKELKWPDNYLKALMSFHVTCCPCALNCADWDSSVPHQILFQIRPLTTQSAHTLLYEKYFLFGALINWFTDGLCMMRRCQQENMMFSRTYGVLWNLKGLKGLGRIKNAVFELLQHSDTLILEGICYWCFQNSDALNRDWLILGEWKLYNWQEKKKTLKFKKCRHFCWEIWNSICLLNSEVGND